MPHLLLSLALALLAGAAPAGATNDTARRQAIDHYHAGKEAMRAESWDRAEYEFHQAINLDPLLVPAHYDLGQTYMATRRYPEAVNAFLGTREAHKQLTALRVTDTADAESRRRDQITELEDAIRLFNSAPVRAKMQQSGSQPENAILKLESQLRTLQQESHLSPGDVQTPAEFSLALGSAYYRNGSLDEAARAYADAIRVNKKLGEAHNNLGVVYMLQGRFDESKKELSLAEKCGFHVNPGLRADLDQRMAGK